MVSERDGLRGLVVLTGAMLCQVILGGMSLSSGIFYVMYREAFNSSPVVTSWLCSLPLTVWFMSAPLGSILNNKFGYRICSMTGGFIAATGISLGFFANDILFLFFTHGILTGLGFGINYTGSMAAVSSYFDKYRTITTGSISIGHNLGLVVFPFIIEFLYNTYSWRGTLLVLGGLAFNMCSFSTLFRPLRDSQAMTTSRKRKSIFNLSVLKKPTFVCFCISNIVMSMGHSIFVLHIPSYAKDIGFSANDIGIVLTIFGITNVIGKIFYSVLGQHPRVNATILYTLSLIVTGVCMALIPVFLSRIGMLILPGCIGFFFAVTGAFFGIVVFRIVGNDRFADGIGLSMPFRATGNLIGGTTAGFLSETSGNYTSSFCLAGTTVVLSALLMIYPIIYHRRRERDHLDVNVNLVGDKKIDNNVLVRDNLSTENKVVIRFDTEKPLLEENT